MTARSKAKDPLDHKPEAVTWAREEAKLTKTQLAAAAGVSLSLISEIEHGTRNARLELIEVIAAACDVSPNLLMRAPEDPSARTRLAVVCTQCSGLWEPDHECPNRDETREAA